MIESLMATIKELPKNLEKSTGNLLERFGKDEVWNEPRDDLPKSTHIEFEIELDDSQVTNEKKFTNEVSINETVKVENEKDIPYPPQPNTRYELPNGDYIITDHQGRVTEKVFTPVLSDDVRTPYDKANTKAVGKEGIEGDEGGHIQAHRLGGSSERINLFPQNENFNRGAYKRFENQIADALKDGREVSPIKVTLSYDDNSNRPSKIEVSYSIDGKPITQTFKNEVGGGLNDRSTTNS